uniref:Uncharacterized protein n=1 Tax=Glossina pallidipes TaxID=7398 RepID=A0A1A9Z399_GLOPL
MKTCFVSTNQNLVKKTAIKCFNKCHVLNKTAILCLSSTDYLKYWLLLATTIANSSGNRGISLQQNHLSTKMPGFAILSMCPKEPRNDELFALLDSFEVDDDDAPLVVVAVVVFVAVDVVELSCKAVGMNILPVNDDSDYFHAYAVCCDGALWISFFVFSAISSSYDDDGDDDDDGGGGDDAFYCDLILLTFRLWFLKPHRLQQMDVFAVTVVVFDYHDVSTNVQTLKYCYWWRSESCGYDLNLPTLILL